MNYNSEYIFDLINEFEILSPAGGDCVFTDESYELFCKKYLQLSKKRNENLSKYLNSSSSLFRCHLPFSKWIYGVAFNIVWYYDEIIVEDPILLHIKRNYRDLEVAKEDLKNLLSFLLHYEQTITGGYILFLETNLLRPNDKQLEELSQKILLNKTLGNEFENWSFIGKKASPINKKEKDNLIQFDVQYKGLAEEVRGMAMYIPPHVFNTGKLASGVTFDFTRPFEKTNSKELKRRGREDMLNTLTEAYMKDIGVIIKTLFTSCSLNAPTLFYRDLDRMIAKQYTQLTRKSSKIVDSAIYESALPFLKNIAPERLLELRNDIPEAFKDFRYFLAETSKKALQTTDNKAEIHEIITRNLNPLERKLESEMKGARKKFIANGIITPLALATGSLALYTPGIDLTPFVVPTLLGAGGVIKTITAAVEKRSEVNKASVNPAYFLWKIKQ